MSQGRKDGNLLRAEPTRLHTLQSTPLSYSRLLQAHHPTKDDNRCPRCRTWWGGRRCWPCPVWWNETRRCMSIARKRTFDAAPVSPRATDTHPPQPKLSGYRTPFPGGVW
jgi:hypothetical protein